MLIRVVIKGRYLGYEFRNIFGYDIDVPDITPAMCDALVQQVINKIYNPMASRILVPAFSIYEGEVLKHIQAREFVRYWATPLSFTGQRGVDGYPPFVSLLLVGKTFAKRLRGLKFITGLAEDIANGMMLLPEVRTAARAAANGYKEVITIDTVTATPVIITRDGQSVQMSTAVVKPRLYSLRRRATDA